MSTRGADFLHKWILNKVPDTVGAGVISVAELTQELFADAKALGIKTTEIEEDVSSAYEAILNAVVRRNDHLAN
ncbi:hypothetical protein NKI86_00035 [Mesorhizobium sp. M0320]|uniref:DUF768 domain-containing protein n=1 Tax=unclassified Mesorhizobium TaxID=325217 RepID=UPI0033361C99